EDAAVETRMERLHATVEHLREPGDVAHLRDGQSRVPDGAGGSAGRDDRRTGVDEGPREVDQSGLVMDADERAPDLDAVHAITLSAQARRQSAGPGNLVDVARDPD